MVIIHLQRLECYRDCNLFQLPVTVAKNGPWGLVEPEVQGVVCVPSWISMLG